MKRTPVAMVARYLAAYVFARYDAQRLQHVTSAAPATASRTPA